MKKIILSVFLCGLCFAQNAQVYDLLPTESAEGAKLYREMKASEQSYSDWASKTSTKYLNGPSGDFDSTFKHVVPKGFINSNPFTNMLTCCTGTIVGTATITGDINAK